MSFYWVRNLLFNGDLRASSEDIKSHDLAVGVAVEIQHRLDGAADGLEVGGGKGENSWACAAEADAEQAGVAGGREGFQGMREARDEMLAVRLVELISHGAKDPVGGGWVLTQGLCKHS